MAEVALERRRERKNQWMAHYALKYGLQPVELSGSVVVRAKCRFCESFGRERPSGAPLKRRKKRQTLKVFGPNFRSDNLESHLWREHARKWHEYGQLADEEKEVFFPTEPFLQENRDNNNEMEETESTTCNHDEAEERETARCSFDSTRSTATSLLSPVSEVSAAATNSEAVTRIDTLSEIRVEASSMVLEVLDQLLGLTLAGSTLKPFVFEEGNEHDTNDNQAGEDESSLQSSWVSDEHSLVSPEPLFLFFVDTFCAGLSVDAVLAVLRATQQLQPSLDPSNVLNGGAPLTRLHVVRAVRQVMAANLASIATLTSNLWGFSLALHFSILQSDFAGSSERRGALLDVRLQLLVDGEPQEVHLVTLPLPFALVNATSSSVIGAAIVCVLSAVDVRAMEKLVGVTIDGDPFEMGSLGIDVARWLRSQAQLAVMISGVSNGTIATFYIRPSGTFLLSLAIEDALTASQRKFAFLSSLAGIKAMFKTNTALRELLVSEASSLSSREHEGVHMDSAASAPPSPLQPTHWVRVAEQCEWLVSHRETLIKWQHDRCNEATAKSLTAALTSNLFWVLVFIFRDLLNLQLTRQHCELESVSYCNVQRHVREYLSQLCLKFNIKPSDVLSQVSLAVNPTVAGDQAVESFTYQDFVNAIIPLNLFMYEAFQLKNIEGIGDTERDSIFKHVSKLLVELQSNLEFVVTTASSSGFSLDEHPATSATQLESFITFSTLKRDCGVVPPSTPYELMMLSNLGFMELLNGHQARLRARWSGKMLTQITDERNRLAYDFAHQSGLYETIEAQHQQQKTGRDAWSEVRMQYPSLYRFAAVFGAHLAVSKPAMLVIGSASTITLEARFHALQLRKLVELRKKLEDTA